MDGGGAQGSTPRRRSSTALRAARGLFGGRAGPAAALILELRRCDGHVLKATAKVEAHRPLEVAAWLQGGLVQFARPSWNQTVQQITGEADQPSKGFTKEREKAWRKWASDSLGQGARATRRFTWPPPAA